MLEKGTTLNKLLYNTAVGYTRYNWTLHEKCPNTEFFLIRIFPHSDSIRGDTEYLSIFSMNVGKYGPQKIRIWTLFMQWEIILLPVIKKLQIT